MVRIVSGQQQMQDPGLAFLAGYQGGQEQKRRARQEQQEQAKLAFTLQKAMADYAEEQRKTLADVNARAQMGQAQALQQQMLEAQAAGAPPEEKMMREFLGVIGNLDDPDARAYATKAYDGLSQYAKQASERKAAESMIADAEKNGWIPQGQFKMRLDSGEPPDVLTKEIVKIKEERTLTGMAKEKNAAALSQMQAFLEAFPDSPEKLQGEFLTTAFMDDQAAQEKPGEGARRLQELQNILLGGQQRMAAEAQTQRNFIEPFADPKVRGGAIDDLARRGVPNPTEEEIRAYITQRDPSAASPFAGLAPEPKGWVPDSARPQNESLERSMPEVPAAPATAPAGVSPEAPKAAQAALDAGATSTKEILDSLKAAGIPITRENLEAAKAQISQYKTSKTAASGGADRKRLAVR